MNKKKIKEPTDKQNQRYLDTLSKRYFSYKTKADEIFAEIEMLDKDYAYEMVQNEKRY